MDFVHLHVHSHYSAEDGVAGVRDLARMARDHGQRALALTDLNTLAGVPAFCAACAEAEVRPVIGAELSVAAHDSLNPAETPYRLVLLAETEAGYRNLVQLVNRAHASGGRRQNVGVRFEDLEKHGSGLIALTGGEYTELYEHLLNGELDDAESYIGALARIFGKENIVFAMQDFGLQKQRQISERLYALAEFLGVKCVATNSVCYLRPEDAICYDFLSNQKPATFLDFHAAKNPQFTRHLASNEQMRQKFNKHPKAIFTTADLAERCSFQPNFERRRFPEHDFVRGFDADSFLWDLTFREAREKFIDLSLDLKERMNLEFDYIRSHNLSNHILLMWNIAQFCRQNRISMGVGRGNEISSLVAYILGLTRINPLDHKLRFLGLGETEGKNLKITVEVSPRHSRSIFNYLQETFGPDFTSAIGRPTWFDRPTLAREIRAWYNHPSLKPEAAAAEDVPDLTRRPGPDAELESFFPGRSVGVPLPNPDIVRFMLTRLLPRPAPLSIEENEFAVSAENLDHITPRVPVDDELVTQFDVAALESFHIPRVSIEANPALNVLDTAAAWVRQEENASFDADRIPLDDPETYELLGRGLTSGIEPFHAITLKSLLRAHRPRNFMQLLKVKSMERSPGAAERDPDIREHVPECLLTYRCAFVKAHYPMSFMASLLTHTHALGPQERRKFTIILREAKQMGLRILPPDINLSIYEFSQVNKSIRTGLMVIGGMTERAYAELERVRRGGNFVDLADIIRRTDSRLITNTLLTNMVKTGALDSFSRNRMAMLRLVDEHADAIRRGGQDAEAYSSGMAESSGPAAANGSGAAAAAMANAALDLNTSEASMTDVIRMEIQAAGYSISQDELKLYKEPVRQARAVAPGGLSTRMVGKEAYVAGFLDHVEADSPLVEDKDHLLLDLEGHVVTMPVKAARLYEMALSANSPVLLGGSVARRRDEVYLKAVTAFTLRMVQEMAQQVLHLDLNLDGEDSRTLRLLARLVKNFRGAGTTLGVRNYEGGAIDRWLVRRINTSRVSFSPPFYYALKKILPEDRINLVATDDMDPALLHALSPLRFPRTQMAGRGIPRMDDEVEVERY